LFSYVLPLSGTDFQLGIEIIPKQFTTKGLFCILINLLKFVNCLVKFLAFRVPHFCPKEVTERSMSLIRTQALQLFNRKAQVK
jgi:hypothetical protein